MKKFLILTSLFLFNQSAIAGSCGVGKITEILEGHWDQNYFVIKIDYTLGSSEHNETNFHSDWIAYRRDSLNQHRFNGIKELAKLAFVNNYSTSTFSHNNDCSNATFLAIYKN